MNVFLKEITDNISLIDSSQTEKLKELVLNTEGKIILLGNGGSNAISSHIAEDYTKVLKKLSISFSDAARLTCYSNDYGYKNAFKEFLSECVNKNDLIILISSSGNSKNIINCAEYCVKNKIKMIILTGFKKKNKLRKYRNNAELEFWINSTNYGIVECLHEIILHSIL